MGSDLVFEDGDIVPGVPYQYLLGLPVENREILRGEIRAAVPDLLSNAVAETEAETGRIVLSWRPGGEAGDLVTVYRRRTDGPWTALGNLHPESHSAMVYEDRNVTSGVEYHYRLGIRVDGTEFFRGETRVVAAVAASEFRIELMTANPATDVVRFAITLGIDAPIRLELFDAGGRRRWSRSAAFGIGRFVIDVEDGNRLASGAYYLRLAQADRQRVVPFTIRK